MVNRRQAFVLALVLAFASAWVQHAGAADAASSSVRIRGVDLTSFPQVKVTVSISGRSVRPQDVHVAEQNRPVSGASVQSLADSGRGVDVVLALDVSNSMAGQLLASVIAAALKFVTTMPTDGTIRVGIVTFADHPRVAQPLTEDSARALQALGSLSASPG